TSATATRTPPVNPASNGWMSKSTSPFSSVAVTRGPVPAADPTAWTTLGAVPAVTITLTVFESLGSWGVALAGVNEALYAVVPTTPAGTRRSARPSTTAVFPSDVAPSKNSTVPVTRSDGPATLAVRSTSRPVPIVVFDEVSVVVVGTPGATEIVTV